MHKGPYTPSQWSASASCLKWWLLSSCCVCIVGCCQPLLTSFHQPCWREKTLWLAVPFQKYIMVVSILPLDWWISSLKSEVLFSWSSWHRINKDSSSSAGQSVSDQQKQSALFTLSCTKGWFVQCLFSASSLKLQFPSVSKCILQEFLMDRKVLRGEWAPDKPAEWN